MRRRREDQPRDAICLDQFDQFVKVVDALRIVGVIEIRELQPTAATALCMLLGLTFQCHPELRPILTPGAMGILEHQPEVGQVRRILHHERARAALRDHEPVFVQLIEHTLHCRGSRPKFLAYLNPAGQPTTGPIDISHHPLSQDSANVLTRPMLVGRGPFACDCKWFARKHHSKQNAIRRFHPCQPGTRYIDL